MHPEAHAYVARAVKELGPFDRVVEFGSLDINGGIRELFGSDYVGMDRHPGPGVDVVADAAEWRPDADLYDCVVCCEVLEHTADWPLLIASAARALRGGGVLIITCAGPGRGSHSAFDGNALRPGEHYANIGPDELRSRLAEQGFDHVVVDQAGLDVRATARRSR